MTAHPVWGITGGMGAGKTWLMDQLSEGLYRRGIDSTCILVDNLRYAALCVSYEPQHIELRDRVSAALGVPLQADGTFDYRELCAAVFSSAATHHAYIALLSPVLRADAAAIIEMAAGPVFLEWARLLEDGFGTLVTGPVVLVTCDEYEVQRRASEISWRSAEAIKARRQFQPSDTERVELTQKMKFDLVHLDTTHQAKANARVAELLERFSQPGPRL